MIVAYSGGVDSTFLLKVARYAFKKNVYAVIGVSETYPESEKLFAIDMCKKLGANYEVIKPKKGRTKILSNNPKDRCITARPSSFLY